MGGKVFWVFENMKEIIDLLPEKLRGSCWKMVIEYAFGDDCVIQNCKNKQIIRTFKAIQPLIKLRCIAGSQNGKSNNPTGLPRSVEPNIGANIGANIGVKKTVAINVITNKHPKDTSSNDRKPYTHNALEIFGNSFKATDAVVDAFNQPDGTTKNGIRIKNPRLMAFVRQRFDNKILEKVSKWAIAHNQRGYTYNASSLLKLFCKFQKDVEPAINYNQVQSEYLTFEYKGENNGRKNVS